MASKKDKEKNLNSNWLDRKLIWFITPAHLIVLLLMGISLYLHLYNISAIGDANLYYTAAVKSMLQSWKNFFFAAAEPGGSVTVDKPSLGLWIETIFAYFLGVDGVVVSLPNILAGVLSVGLIFYLTKKYFGSLAGIIAAAVYVITPIVLAADRNNTIDGMLVFTLLLAAWAFIKATDTGKFIYLLIGSVLVGLGFNIKMLQAYLVLPAFLLLFFLGAKTGWGKRILFSIISVLVILAVSLSWAVIVDLTPAEERPYIGSSEDNTVMELIIGHNGLARLFGRHKNQPPQGMAPNAGQVPHNGPPPGNLPPRADGQSGQVPRPPQGNIQQPQGGMLPPQSGGNAFSHETGSPGIFRLFQAPLGKEMSWLLPFALFSLVMIAFSAPISLMEMSPAHKGVILWGGWLLTCIIFFSMADFFHAYYMIMLAPPLAVLVGAGFTWMVNGEKETDWKTGAAVFALLLTLIFETYLAMEYIGFTVWMILPLILFLVSAAILLFIKKEKGKKILAAFLLVSVLLIPTWWSIKTVSDDTPHVGLPSAYAGSHLDQKTPPPNNRENSRMDALISYLEENTTDTEYLVAVTRANSGAPFVLATGRPVLYMGGFTGSDPVIDADGLQEMVANGELRYFFYENIEQENDREIREWLRNSCSIVEEFSAKPITANRDQQQQNVKQPVLLACY